MTTICSCKLLILSFFYTVYSSLLSSYNRLRFHPAVCCCPLPDAVTTEEEAEEEDTDARPKDDPVDVDGQVLEGDGHGAGVIGVNQAQTTEAP